MFLYRVQLFRLFGFKVYVDASWLLLAVLIIWSLAATVFPYALRGYGSATYVWMGVAAAVGFLVSILVHETAHALVARRFQMPIRGITLFVFGGVAEMEGEPTSAKGEFLMAAAGPATSVLLGFLFLVGAGLAADSSRPAAVVLEYLGGLNWVVAVFNLLPAFPLDGGRMLRAVLWRWRGDFESATRTAAGAGQVCGVFLILLGLFLFIRGAVLNGVWLFLIGLLLRGAASMAYQQALTRTALGGEPVSRFMTADPIAVTPETSIQSLVDDYIYRHHHKAFPVVRDGRLIGCIGTTEIGRLDRVQWQERLVESQMQPCGADQVTTPREDALQALAKMSRSGASRLFVTEGDRLVGVLSLTDLVQFLALKLELEGPQSVKERGPTRMGPPAHV
jgi:Zn-dependent protease